MGFRGIPYIPGGRQDSAPKEEVSERVLNARLKEPINEPVSELEVEEQDSELSASEDESLTASAKMQGN